MTARGSCDPPTEPPDGFASRVCDAPGRQIRKERIFASAEVMVVFSPLLQFCYAKMLLAAYMPPLRI